MRAKGVKPDEVTFTMLINACHNRSADAKFFFEEMQKVGLKPSPYTYSAYLTVLGRSNDLETLRPMAKSLESTSNLNIIHSILTVYSMNEMHKEAIDIFEGLPVRGIAHSVELLRRISPSLTATGQQERVFELIEALVAKQLRFDANFFRYFVVGLMRVADYKNVLRVRDIMIKLKIAPHSITEKDFADAQRWLEKEQSQAAES